MEICNGGSSLNINQKGQVKEVIQPDLTDYLCLILFAGRELDGGFPHTHCMTLVLTPGLTA